MTSPSPLLIHGWGAVTPVGLDSGQTCAAVRAGLSRYEVVYQAAPADNPHYGARIPVAVGMRPSHLDWLANMAGRALRECLRPWAEPISELTLILCLPDPPRWRGSFEEVEGKRLLAAIAGRLEVSLSPASRCIPGGPGALALALAAARSRLEAGATEPVVVGGVDSLVGIAEIDRLRRRDRIHGGLQPHGMFPAEGAGFVLLARPGGAARRPVRGRVVGVGLGREANAPLGPRPSIGEGLCAALAVASADASLHEADIAYVCSNANGEGFYEWERNYAHLRYYRTRRPELPVVFTQAHTGDLGAASGVLALIVAASAMNLGYGPGRRCMVELASEGELRSACVVEPGELEALTGQGRRALAQLWTS